MTLGLVSLYLLFLYVIVGLAVGVTFVVVGVSRVQPASYTPGARLLLLPASVALWPYVLIRWLKARGVPRSAQ